MNTNVKPRPMAAPMKPTTPTPAPVPSDRFLAAKAEVFQAAEATLARLAKR